MNAAMTQILCLAAEGEIVPKQEDSWIIVFTQAE